MHDVFGSARIGPRALALAAAGSLAILPVTWVEERWRARAGSEREQRSTGVRT